MLVWVTVQVAVQVVLAPGAKVVSGQTTGIPAWTFGCARAATINGIER